MNKANIIIILLFITIVTFITYNIFLKKGSLYEYKSPIGNVIITSPYNLNELKNIPIINLTNISEIRNKYQYYILLIDPNGYGNYTVAYTNLKIKIPNLIDTCSYYYKGCLRYLENITFDDYYPIHFSSYNTTYLFPKNVTLLIDLLYGNKTEIIYKDGKIELIGNNYTIDKVAWRFILYWYGIGNN